MKIEQIYTNCLSQGAYFIESDGEIAVIDPLREVQNYIDKAGVTRGKIKYIFETHFHADFVSGHVTLAEHTGAQIVFGPLANPSYNAHIAENNEIFKIGKITLTALHTPGHTMESTCYLLKDENGKDYALFSGDTLFIGDVGRPDLAQKSQDITQEHLAELLFDSLRSKIMILDNDVILYPAHGAGSACGKNLSNETISTIGEQKKNNYALRANMTRQEFVSEVTDGLLPPPSYFSKNVNLNKAGYIDVEKIIKNVKPLNAKTFNLIANEINPLILDVRHQDDYTSGHIPESIFIGLDGEFAPWVGRMILDIKQPILLITPVGRENEAITRLARVGYDNSIGYLKGGFDTWIKAEFEIEILNSITPNELEKIISDDTLIYDLRKPSEYNEQHILNVNSSPLDFFNNNLEEFPKINDFFVHCAGGYRSVIGASVLLSKGHKNVINIKGGFGAIKKTSIKTTST